MEYINANRKVGAVFNFRNEFLLLAFFYLAAHIWILIISNATYWDDWILMQGQPAIVVDMFIQQAATLFYLEGYSHIVLLKIGPWFYRWMTLVLMFCAGLCLNEILKMHANALNSSLRLLVVILFLVAPFNIARIALVDFRYTLCYFMFFLAWYFMPKRRDLAAACFFISFNTQSLLVFYALPVIDIFVREKYKFTKDDLCKFISGNKIFLILPFLYFAIKIYFFQSSGIYQDYNKGYRLENLIGAPMAQFHNILEIQLHLIDFLGIALLSLFSGWILSVYLFRGGGVDLSNSESVPAKSRFRIRFFVMLFGMIAFLTGSFPYWILGHVPTFNEWSSRHQLLLPLGFSLLFAALVPLLRLKFLILLAVSFVIGFSVWINFKNYAYLFVDSRKSIALINLIAKNSEIRDSNLLIFIDKTMELNALDRTYRNYEWNGIVKAAFGDESRYSVDYKNWRIDKTVIARKEINKYYMAGDFDPADRLAPVFVLIERSHFERQRDFWTRLIVSPSDAFVLKIASEIDVLDH